ncbi:MAG: TIGR00269 family protein [Asgard group archaeon]|nr:TIGR00269 family protein [Asgard group archaeon]
MSKSLPNCHSCSKRPAVTYRRIDGRYLCKECFSKWVTSIVRKTISQKKLFERNDRIIVGLSGGKDSTVLLDILHKVERKYPSELIAICIDEGISNYREDGLPIAEMIAKKLDVEFHLFSFKDLFGHSLDEIINRSQELQKNHHLKGKAKLVRHGPCSFCGVFRRKALNIAARKLNGDKVATGHNLNDVSQTILLNLLRGDSTKLLRGDLKPEKAHELFVPRVKPLQGVAERDVVLYAFYNELTYHTTECPYAVEAMRLDVRNFSIEIEEKYPGTLNCIKNSMDIISQKWNDSMSDLEINEKTDSFYLCKICSEPASSKICKGCQMLDTLFKEKKHEE